jgi:hypothetical protein
MKHSIHPIIAGAMIFMAVILDIIQFFISFIPFIGFIIAPCIGIIAAVFFGLWFAAMGVNYFGGKKAHLKIIAIMGASVSEIIPLFDMLPAITCSVLVIIFAVWLEARPDKKAVVRDVRGLARMAKKTYDRGTGAVRRPARREQVA